MQLMKNNTARGWQRTQRRRNFDFMTRTLRIAAILFAGAFSISAADYPLPIEGEYTLRDFKFASGETLPELRIHYRALGRREKTADGKTNVVLIMHGTT